jgi:photosystem II stability/assembly factor-like uncharacterized protein
MAPTHRTRKVALPFPLASLALALLTLALAGAAQAHPYDAKLKGPSGQCLGIDGNPREGAPVVLEACTHGIDQNWRLPEDGFAGPVQIGELCLDVDDNSTVDGTRLQLFGCHGGENQRWARSLNGAFVGLAGKCLAVASGSAAVLDTCDGGNPQKFLIDSSNRWSRFFDLSSQPVHRVFLTSDPDVVYGGSIPSFGLHPLVRSADGGSSLANVTEVGLSEYPMLVDPNNPDVLFARNKYDDKLLRSGDGGQSWRAVISDFVYVVRPSRVAANRFFAASRNAIWRSDDGGLSFTKIGAPVGDVPQPTNIPLDLAEGADGTLYLAKRVDGQVAKTFYYRSVAGGWQSLPVIFDYAYPEAGDRIVVHPTETDLIYLVRPEFNTSDTRLYRSANGGWQPINVPAGKIERLFVTHDDANAVWALLDGVLLRSEDRGANWQTALSIPGHKVQVEAFPTEDGLRWLARSDEPTPQYFESLDGRTYVQRQPFGLFGTNIGQVVASRVAGRFYAVDDATIRRTDDGGRSWRAMATLTVDSIVDLIEDPLDANTLYATTATYHFHGIVRSRDGGATFPDVLLGGGSGGSHLGVAVHNSGRVLLRTGGVNTLERSTDDGATWTDIALPTDVDYIAADGGAIYGSAGLDGDAVRSLDGGLTWQSLGPVQYPLEVGAGLLVYIEDGNAGELVLSSDRGNTWIKRRLPSPGGFNSRVWIDGTGALFFRDSAGVLFHSSTEGISWLAAGDGLGGSWASDVVADAADPDRKLVATEHGLYATRLTDDRPLILQSGRFEIAVKYLGPTGSGGAAHAQTLTSDSGLFWFFTPERSEVAVKVLDARGIDGRFWVFVASLSNVAFDVEVFDRASGQRRLYHNPQGTMASFADNAAFPLGGPEPAVAPLASSPTTMLSQTGIELHDRFEISVDWRTPAGLTGAGHGTRLTVESAVFYFFSPDNIELMINVIDGRPVNGKYWVFFAGLSNVEYTVRIRDRSTGEIQLYHNPQGQFASFADTEAF